MSMIGGIMRSKRMMVGLLVAMLVAVGGGLWTGPAVSASALSAATAAGPAGGDGHTMVLSIGDSYIAGSGVGHYYDGQGPGFAEPDGVKRVPGSGANCYQSYSSYPWQYVQMLRDAGRQADIWHAACHGAWTYDLWDQFWVIPAEQRDQADVLLISAGGNDVGFANLVAHCLLGLDEWVPGVSSGTCDGDLHHARTELPRMMARLESTITDLSPFLPGRTTVVVVGYPDLNSPGCLNARGEQQLLQLQSAHEAALAEMVTKLDRAKANRKLRHSYRVELPADRFAGHGPCALTDRWIHGLSTTQGHSFHPNWTGANEYAGLLFESSGVVG